ncbi:hypothetical protein V2J09_013934 [Rumex salicifolius]
MNVPLWNEPPALLRYEQSCLRDTRIGEMGVLSHKVKRYKIKAGDHIYTWRAAFTYSHHGIYIGEGKVVHFTPAAPSTSIFTISSSSSIPAHLEDQCTLPECAWTQPRGGVVISCLDCFIGSGSLYLYDYGVSWFVFLTKIRGGTCTTAKPDPPEEAVDRATYLVRSGFGKYDVLKNNCEDFALYCKTGLVVVDRGVGGSGQVMQASSVVGAPLLGIGSYLLASCTAGVATGAAGVFYISRRYGSDMGVRKDVVKIGVKDLAVNLG